MPKPKQSYFVNFDLGNGWTLQTTVEATSHDEAIEIGHIVLTAQRPEFVELVKGCDAEEFA